MEYLYDEKIEEPMEERSLVELKVIWTGPQQKFIDAVPFPKSKQAPGHLTSARFRLNSDAKYINLNISPEFSAGFYSRRECSASHTICVCKN